MWIRLHPFVRGPGYLNAGGLWAHPAQKWILAVVGKESLRNRVSRELGVPMTTAVRSRASSYDGLHGSRTGRPAYPQLLEPKRLYRREATKRLAARAEHWNPVAATLAVAGASFVVLAAVAIGVGLLITHVVAHSRLGHSDEQLNIWFAVHRTHLWDLVSLDLTKVADVPGVAIVAVGVTILLVVRKWGRFAAFPAIGLVLELAVFELSEHVVRRPRPHIAHLGVTPRTFSWPSGHTAATVVLYGGIALLVTLATRRSELRALAWSIALLLSLGVAWARIYEGEHHLSDTIGGLLLGIGCLYATVLVMRTWGLSEHHPELLERRENGKSKVRRLTVAP